MASKLVSKRNLFVLALAGLALAVLLIAVAASGDPGASAGAPQPDFSMGINVDGVAGDDCDTGGGPATCQFPVGTMFTVNSYLNSIGHPVGLEGTSVYTAYSGVSIQFMENMNPNTMWPGCTFEGSIEGAGFVATGCSLGLSAAPIFYTGLVSTAVFACTADGSITMVHGAEETLLANNTGLYYEAGPDETLTIDCVDPLPYPGDTDGDGCPDTKEAGMNPMQGGMRNFLNPWDYFNPTHDGENRIDDPLLVKNQYYVDQGNPAYNPDTDRTLVGPNTWNLGQPNGLQRVDDVLNVVKQYYHDCS